SRSTAGLSTSTRPSSRSRSSSTREETSILAEQDSAGYGTGRRKTAVARVRLLPGDGKVTINEKPALQYLGRRTLEMVVMEPFRVVETKRFDASVKVVGGGVSGQAGAVAHGVARALLEHDPERPATQV